MGWGSFSKASDRPWPELRRRAQGSQSSLMSHGQWASSFASHEHTLQILFLASSCEQSRALHSSSGSNGPGRDMGALALVTYITSTGLCYLS